jgi:excisionase family DNA binding protein
MNAQLLDVREVSEMLGCGCRTVWRLADRGAMPAPIRPGGTRAVRWRRGELEAWIEAGAPDLSIGSRRAG